MTNRTPNEAKANYQAKLGKEFGQIFYGTYNEWVNLKIVWDQYENLFGSGKERVKLLNSAGASFFRSVERSFFETTIMAICRLSDPVATGRGERKKENLTVKRFQNFMDTVERENKMSCLLTELDTSVDFQRDWRNRRIGHNDLELKLGIAEPLKFATGEKMNKAIKDFHSIFSYIGIEFMETHFADTVISSLNNEIHMLHTLFDGVAVREKEMADFRAGKISQRSKKPTWLLLQKN